MLGTLFLSSDVVSTSYGAAIVATLATAVLALLGLSWVSERWRIPLALAGVAALASSLSYVDAGQVWLTARTMSSAYRYIGWFTSQPMEIAAIYFLACIAGPVPVGIFWRSIVAALLMVLCRYLGDAHIFPPVLGVLLSIAFWLYILGELYFGAMSGAVHRSSRPMRIGYFWIRLILTLGWALYPILFFVDVVGSVGQAHGVIVLYTVIDVFNLITVSLIILSLSGKERY